MKSISPLCLALIIGNAVPAICASTLPPSDLRLGPPVDLNSPRVFPEIKTRSQWEHRAQLIKEQILFSAGLWPMPEKTPLRARISDRVEYGDFSVEKVVIETYPHFYLAGNLYRPVGRKGPFPGVLNPHGHWATGRLEDVKDGSIPARCISQARMGMVAFAYDMVGYNDTQFGDSGAEKPGYRTHRSYGNTPADLLWHTTLMGLQTWNSIRALDFLCSLPDVDTKRLACTGASGGGTQTFILGAVDERLSVLAPTVMVSHSMQGGCSCENMPGLRIEFSNMEIAAVPAPKPQIFMASSGDWTKTFMTIEGPAIRSVYRLFGAEDRVFYKVLNYGHNYNQDTREHVYAFFARHLLGKDVGEKFPEAPYPPASNLNLRVFAPGKQPADAITQDGLRDYLRGNTRAQFAAAAPHDAASLRKFTGIYLPAWRHGLQLDATETPVVSETLVQDSVAGLTRIRLDFGRAGRGDRIPAVWLTPQRGKPSATIVLAHTHGKNHFLDEKNEPTGLAKSLLSRNFSVLLLDLFQTGELVNARAAKHRTNQVDLFFTTYNRTDTQERAQDLLTACSLVRQKTGRRPVYLCGVGRAGLWALLAAPAADGVVADCDRVDLGDDAALLAPDIFVPGLKKFGGFETAALLAAPRPLLIHNATLWPGLDFIKKAYSGLDAAGKLQVKTGALSNAEIVEALSGFTRK